MPALVIAAALAATPIGPPACANTLVQPTAAAGTPPAARKLGDLPPARLMRLVLRRVDGCELAEVRQASGAWANVPAGPAFTIAEPARKGAPGDRKP